MRVILLGCPGAGKGTQAQHLSEHFNIPLISTGHMLREAVHSGSRLGLKVKLTIDSGEFVSDQLIIDLVKDRISKNDCKTGYLLDGFPRNITQAKALHKANVDIDYVVDIDVPDEKIISRMSGRRVHMSSGRTYHLEHNLPKTPNVDDITGEPLTQRDDDIESTVRERLKIYHEKTKPLVSYYKDLANDNITKYIHIDGAGTIKQTQELIFSSLEIKQ